LLTSLHGLLAMSAIAHTHQKRFLRVEMLYISSKVTHADNAVCECSKILSFSTMGKFVLKRQQPKMLVETLTTNGHGQPQQPQGPPKDDHLLAYRKYCSTLGIDAEKGTTSFDERIRRDYRWHTVQYWFVASIANGMLWAQIIIGAAITALGATNAPGSKTATIYLGAASTVIAGFLTYFKSRNQPNRSRQFRQALRKVRNKMDETAHEISNSTTPEEAVNKAMDILKLYEEALAEAATNYPDLWVTVSDMKKLLPGANETGPNAVDAVTKPDIVPPPNDLGAVVQGVLQPAGHHAQPNLDNRDGNRFHYPGALVESSGQANEGSHPQHDEMVSPEPPRDLEKRSASVDVISTSTS